MTLDPLSDCCFAIYGALSDLATDSHSSLRALAVIAIPSFLEAC